MSTSDSPDQSVHEPIEGLTYEQALAELESIVAALESGDHALDAALALYERGQALARQCGQLLDKAEMKIQSLSGENLVDFNAE
jgi:exodeoxyribonuclease VII small subunit